MKVFGDDILECQLFWVAGLYVLHNIGVVARAGMCEPLEFLVSAVAHAQ